MLKCPQCGGHLFRVPRHFFERFRWEAAFECDACRYRTGSLAWYMVFLSRTSVCPRCGTDNLKRLTRRDRIDRLWKNPISLLQGLLGAPIHWCPYCRLQFYDRRKLAGSSALERDSASAPK